jgi:alkylation response protein AidB-like acyl-CoA dehydrogenase
VLSRVLGRVLADSKRPLRHRRARRCRSRGAGTPLASHMKIGEGTSEIQRMVIGRTLLRRHKL